LFFILEKDKI